MFNSPGDARGQLGGQSTREMKYDASGPFLNGDGASLKPTTPQQEKERRTQGWDGEKECDESDDSPRVFAFVHRGGGHGRPLSVTERGHQTNKNLFSLAG